MDGTPATLTRARCLRRGRDLLLPRLHSFAHYDPPLATALRVLPFCAESEPPLHSIPARARRGKVEEKPGKPPVSTKRGFASNVDKLCTPRMDKPLTGMDNGAAVAHTCQQLAHPFRTPADLPTFPATLDKRRTFFLRKKCDFSAPRPRLHSAPVLPFSAESEPPPTVLRSLCLSAPSVIASASQINARTLEQKRAR